MDQQWIAITYTLLHLTYLSLCYSEVAFALKAIVHISFLCLWISPLLRHAGFQKPFATVMPVIELLQVKTPAITQKESP